MNTCFRLIIHVVHYLFSEAILPLIYSQLFNFESLYIVAFTTGFYLPQFYFFIVQYLLGKHVFQTSEFWIVLAFCHFAIVWTNFSKVWHAEQTRSFQLFEKLLRTKIVIWVYFKPANRVREFQLYIWSFSVQYLLWKHNTSTCVEWLFWTFSEAILQVFRFRVHMDLDSFCRSPFCNCLN